MRPHARGQSLVEFALTLPMLLVLLLGVADFGRLFSAGITIEAAARNAAEVGAMERLRNRPDPGTCDPACLDAYYASVHQMVARIACSESRLQPNATFIESDDPGTVAFDESRTCPSMPVIRACVRDNLDPRCGDPIPGFTPDPVPSECNQMTEPWSAYSGGEFVSHSVEVRVCYHFTTLFNLHLSLGLGFAMNLGDVWIQRSRVFVIDCPPGDVSTC